MKHITKIALILALFFSSFNITEAKLIISKLYADHMVIQRNQPIVVWGRADGNENVVVRFYNIESSVKTDDKGEWKILLPKMEAGGPYEMVISTGKDKIVIKDILIGDVWLSSGQSNMEWIVANSNNAEEEIKNSTDLKIRQFDIPNTSSEKPESDLLGGEWKLSNPENTGEFSAVAYFFAKELRKHIDVPIGLINSSWGGSRIAVSSSSMWCLMAWMPARAMSSGFSFAPSTWAAMRVSTEPTIRAVTCVPWSASSARTEVVRNLAAALDGL